MVRKDGNYWICEICKLKYRSRKWAEKCEEWCRKNKSCNLEITSHAIKDIKNPLSESSKKHGLIGTVLLVTGSITALFGAFGALGLCCTPLIVGLFALFGISSTAFLMTYNLWFLLLASISFILAAYFFRRRRMCNH